MPIALSTIALAALGCTAKGVLIGRSAAPAAWVSRHGGLTGGPQLARAAEVGQRLLRVAPEWSHCRFLVMESDQVGAYSWSSGEIYLTGALVDRCSDEQLAAIIAHEIGHMIDDHRQTPAAFGGHGQAREVRADRAGCGLLARAGIPQAAMISALRVVCAAQPDPACRQNIQKRIDRLAANGDPAR